MKWTLKEQTSTAVVYSLIIENPLDVWKGTVSQIIFLDLYGTILKSLVKHRLFLIRIQTVIVTMNNA